MVLVAGQGAAAEAPWSSWQTKGGADHPLVGRIWSVEARAYVDPNRLAAAAVKADFVLLGEIHDNPDHHRLQAWLIDRLAGAGRRPAVVLEMIRADQQEALSRYLASEGAGAAGLGAALDWERQGWPAWTSYRPIAEAALAAGLLMAPGDASRDTIRKAGREGLASFAEAERARLAVEPSLPKPLAEALLEELFLSHCELMPKESLGPMTQVQRLRDAALADALLRAGETHGAVLVAGNGHVRTDRGVPLYLARRAPQASRLALVLIEVADQGVVDPEALIPVDPEGRPAADFVWFTPVADRDDPCDKLRAQMKDHAPR